jgi:integrase
MGKPFTETWLRSLEKHPPAKRVDYTEPGRKGLMLRHWPGGERTFVVRFIFGGKTRILTLGTYPALSLERAHDEHGEVRRQLSRGLDPFEERKEAARQREEERQQRRHTNAITIRSVIAEWGWFYARRERKRPREAVRLLRVNTKSWEGRPVAELTKRDVVRLLDSIAIRAPVMANRIDALGKQAFLFAVERDLIPANPWVGRNRPGGEERSRQRKLTDDEIHTLWTGLDDPKGTLKATLPVRLALKLVLITAQRPGEVAGARWDEIDTAAGTWIIPQHRTKPGREQHVPLSDLAIELFDQLRLLAKDRPHVFPSAHVKQKRDEPMLELALSRALRNNRDEETDTIFTLEWFTPHDLRRTAASGMTALGTSRLVVSKILNHSERDTTSIYDRHDYAPEKKAALQAWADHLRAVVAGKRPKVVSIKSQAEVHGRR